MVDPVCQLKVMAGVAIKKKDAQGVVLDTAGLSQNILINTVLSSQEAHIVRDNAQERVNQLLKSILSNQLFKR